jgi:NAD+ diphosphatase
MIHEISPNRFTNNYIANTTIHKNDFVLHFSENTLLLKINGDDFEIPRKKDLPEISEKTNRTFLFTLNDDSCFLIWDNLKEDKPYFVFKEIGFFKTIKQQEIAWISIVGFQLMNWYTQNKFCGKCGTKTQQKKNERALDCPNCHTVIYPKISPAIIVTIVCNDRILLARNSNFSGNWFSLVAGYVDVGESLEEALIREVKEEVGLDVKNIRYYKSQPWPLSGSMMIGFIAEADDTQQIVLDEKEIAEAAWFTRGNLPKHSSNISIAGEMISKFEKGEL